MSRSICHESSHTGELLDLLVRSSRSRVCHHVDVVIGVQTVQQLLCQSLIRILPGLYYFIISLGISDESALVVPCDLVHAVLSRIQEILLL